MNAGSRSGMFRFFSEKFKLNRPDLYATPILIVSLIITVLLTLLIYNTIETQERRDFVVECQDIYQKLLARLEAHALMLRSGATFFTMADTVTREDWNRYVSQTRIYRYLPDVQGVGFAQVIPPDLLDRHISKVRDEGFPQYSVYPSHRREFYTSIVFVEPFTGRNYAAFGYDMFTDTVRRRAMELSRDFDVAALTERIKLSIATGGEELYGVIMFVPVYGKNAPAENAVQRQEAIRGWLYSPYRIKTLMEGLQESFHMEKGYRMQLYDGEVSPDNLLYDSYGIGTGDEKSFGRVGLVIPLEFNTNQWELFFSRPGVFPVRAIITLATGVIMSLLLYYLALGFSKIALRSAQIKTQNKELSLLNATKDKFFSIIAHDLKSPYNAVLGFSDILVKKADNMERQEIIRVSEIIRKSANLAVDLLANLMLWSWSHTGRMEYEPEDLHVSDLFEEVKLLYSNIVIQKKIELIIHTPAGLRIHADRSMVGTVLRNLVSNAVKFTHPEGKVTLIAESHNEEVLIKVSDTGVGIPASEINKLFRLDEHYTTEGTQKEKGTGLGLILCREFVEKHSGRIWAESRTGDTRPQGSTFFFTLPAAQE